VEQGVEERWRRATCGRDERTKMQKHFWVSSKTLILLSQNLKISKGGKVSTSKRTTSQDTKGKKRKELATLAN
jgi:hypothetical protein